MHLFFVLVFVLCVFDCEESSELSVSSLKECICDMTFVSTVLPDMHISVISTCTLRCLYHGSLLLY